MKKLFILALVVWMVSAIGGMARQPIDVAAMTEVPYYTYTEDSNGHLITTQAGYVPSFSWSIDNFKRIKEMQVIDDYLYVLIGKTIKSIMVYNPQFELVTSIKIPDAIDPQGFYIKDNLLYVTDFGEDFVGFINVYELDFETWTISFVRQIGRPDTPLFGVDQFFTPSKIAIDGRGNLYVVSEGALNGVLQMDSTGQFFGYFGGNLSDVSPIDVALSKLFPERFVINYPPTPTNVAIDDEGYIYTLTEGLERDALKKFNLASRNFFPDRMNVIQYNLDLAMGNHNNVYTIAKTGVIREYDRSGNMLFSFGGQKTGDSRLGLFETPVSLVVNSRNQIIIADTTRKEIQVLEETNFAHIVHQAIDMYELNQYEEGIGLWNEVLQYNSLFELAYRGIGDFYMSSGQYALAMESYYKTNYATGYSQAFWEVRNLYIDQYVGGFFVFLLIFQVLWLGKKQLNKRGKKVLSQKIHDDYHRLQQHPLYQDLTHIFKVIAHPLDAFYDIKHRHSVTVYGATFWYVMIAVVYFIRLLVSNYLFVGAVADADVAFDLVVIYGAVFTFVIMNYLVCSIREGSAFFREIYIGTIYALFPILIVTMVMSFASTVLTFNELFVYNYIHSISYVWAFVLMFFMVKDLHNYEVGETIINSVLTLFSMMVVLFVLFMAMVVVNQSAGFFTEIIREMMMRVQGQ